MCGSVGLFIGCAAVAFCPASQLRHPSGPLLDESSVVAPRPYRSAFKSWDARASVRSSPRRRLQKRGGVALFPIDLVPVAGHPLVQGLGPDVLAEITTRQMYRYLHFTAKLEYLVVNHVALGIANGDIKVPIPEEMRFDAFRIYCDEAYHAYFSVDLMRQAEEITGLTAPTADEEPYFITRLRALQGQHETKLSGLIEIAFTIVSETLITATLNDVARGDGLVDPAVTETVRDHSLDEGRHHAYFASYLTYLWSSLDSRERQFVGRLFPQLIQIFLDPDRHSIAAELASYRMPADDIQQVIAEVFSDEIRSAYNRATSARLISYLRELGVFEDEAVVEMSYRLGLAVDTSEGRRTQSIRC